MTKMYRKKRKKGDFEIALFASSRSLTSAHGSQAFRMVDPMMPGVVDPPVMVPLKPNFNVPPFASEPFHERLLTVYRVPMWLTISAFQIDVISKFESNSSTQPLLMFDPVVFLTVISPPKPGNQVPVTDRTAAPEDAGGAAGESSFLMVIVETDFSKVAFVALLRFN